MLRGAVNGLDEHFGRGLADLVVANEPNMAPAMIIMFVVVGLMLISGPIGFCFCGGEFFVIVYF